MAPTTTNAHSGFDLASVIAFTSGPTTTGVAAPTTSNSVSTTINTLIAETTYNSTKAAPAPRWAAGRTSFGNLSVWAYLALGVIIVAVVTVLGYTFYSCCRTAARVERMPCTGDDENGDGDGGEDGEKDVGCHADGVVGNGPRADGTKRTSLSETRGSALKTVTPPRRNRNGWHANDGSDIVQSSYPYALDCDGNPRKPPPAYVHSRVLLESLWRDPKLSPVGGSLV